MSFKSLEEKTRSTAQSKRAENGAVMSYYGEREKESRYTMKACQEYLAPLRLEITEFSRYHFQFIDFLCQCSRAWGYE